MVIAVWYLPLAEATVILFAGPFLVLALSGWLLGERVGAASWIGVVVGFIAVLIVARPGFSELSQYTIFPLIAAVFYAGFQLLTRHLGTSGEAPTTTLAWTLLVGIIVGLPLAIASWTPQTLETWILSFILGVIFGFAQLLMAKAFSLAPANLLTPFTYFPDPVGPRLRLPGFRRHPGHLDLRRHRPHRRRGALRVRTERAKGGLGLQNPRGVILSYHVRTRRKDQHYRHPRHEAGFGGARGFRAVCLCQRA